MLSHTLSLSLSTTLSLSHTLSHSTLGGTGALTGKELLARMGKAPTEMLADTMLYTRNPHLEPRNPDP